MRGRIREKNVAHEPADQARHAVAHTGNGAARKPQARQRSEREVVNVPHECRSPRIAFGEFECRAEIGVVSHYRALFAVRRHEAVAPQRYPAGNGGELGTQAEIGLDAGGSNQEVAPIVPVRASSSIPSCVSRSDSRTTSVRVEKF